MPISLRISVLIVSFVIFLVVIKILKNGRIPEKYSIIWFLLSFLIFLVGLFPDFISIFSKLIGFEVMSNMIISIVLVLLIFISITLTVMIAGQKKKTTLLIQEVSILKKKLEEIEK